MPQPSANDQIPFSPALVVIGVIVVGAVVGTFLINTAGHGPSPNHQTRFLLQNLSAIAVEYEVRTGEWVPGSFESPQASMRSFLTTVNREPYTKNMVANLGLDYLELDAAGDAINVTDAWGRAIWYVPYNDGGSSQLPRRGTAEAPQPFFVSPGADGKWGHYINGQPDDDARDNLFSFEFQ